MNRFNVLPFLATLVFFVLSPFALHAQHSDVLLVDVGGQVTIGSAADVDGPEESFDVSTITFESILLPGLIPPTPADYETTEPGFFGLDSVADAGTLATLGASALPSTASVSISLSNFSIDGASADLFYWDGVGSVDFNPAPAGTSFAFDPSVGFATTDANGGMDDHPIFELNTAGAAIPADGVYLISPVVDVAGLTASDPFFLVLLADSLIAGENDAEAVEDALELIEEGQATNAIVDFGNGNIKDFAFYEEAVEYVESTLAVPEPSSVWLSLLAMNFFVASRIKKLA